MRRFSLYICFPQSDISIGIVYIFLQQNVGQEKILSIINICSVGKRVPNDRRASFRIHRKYWLINHLVYSRYVLSSFLSWNIWKMNTLLLKDRFLATMFVIVLLTYQISYKFLGWWCFLFLQKSSLCDGVMVAVNSQSKRKLASISKDNMNP